MKTYEHTEFNTKRVGKGYRIFNGERYVFFATAKMIGSFADNGYNAYLNEVQHKANYLRNTYDYNVRVVPNTTGDNLIYIRDRGE